MTEENRPRPNGPGAHTRRPGPLGEGLRRLWWIPVAAFVLFALLGLGRAMLQEPEYSSTAQVVVKAFDNLQSQLNSGGSSGQDSNKTVATLRQLVKVDEIVGPVATAVGLPASRSREIKRRTLIETQVDSDLIGITVVWPDKNLSQRIAQAYADEFVQYRARLDTAPLVAAQRDIRARIDELEASEAGADYLRQLLNAELDLRTRIAIGSRNSEVAERASDPEKVAPTPLKTAILFGMGGLAMGLFVVALLQATDNRVRSESEAGKALGCAASVTIAGTRMSDGAQRLVMLDHPAAPAAEPYRILATTLELNGIGRERQVLMVCSAVPDSGGSTVASNVAIAAARSGRLVALCDLNLRRPQLEQLFGLDHAIGVGDVLGGEATLDDALHVIALDGGKRVGPTCGLWVMPVGGVVGSPADLSGSVRLGELIDSLRARFELVLLNVPPWMVAGDALAIGRRVDAVLPVVQNGSPRPALVAMRLGLQQLRILTLGMAFIDPRGAAAGSYSGHAYGPVVDEAGAAERTLPVTRLRSRIEGLRNWGRG